MCLLCWQRRMTFIHVQSRFFMVTSPHYQPFASLTLQRAFTRAFWGLYHPNLLCWVSPQCWGPTGQYPIAACRVSARGHAATCFHVQQAGAALLRSLPPPPSPRPPPPGPGSLPAEGDAVRARSGSGGRAHGAALPCPAEPSEPCPAFPRRAARTARTCCATRQVPGTRAASAQPSRGGCRSAGQGGAGFGLRQEPGSCGWVRVLRAHGWGWGLSPRAGSGARGAGVESLGGSWGAGLRSGLGLQAGCGVPDSSC